MINICFRVDSSSFIGIGHLKRCLALANELRNMDVNSLFLCSDLDGNVNSLVKDNGFELLEYKIPKIVGCDENKAVYPSQISDTFEQPVIDFISKTADAVILDHYFIPSSWENKIQKLRLPLVVIDDLADRPHHCDIVVDTNHLGDRTPFRYDDLVSHDCLKLLGPKFSILGTEYSQLQNLKPRNGKVKRILVCMGGADHKNETLKVLSGVKKLNRSDLFFDVVIGPSNQFKQIIINTCQEMSNARLHIAPTSLLPLMNDADLMISGGGTTNWERLCLGLPGIIIGIAENQREINEVLHSDNLAFYLGQSENVSEKDIIKALVMATENKNLLLEQSNNSMLVIDGKGAYRLAKKIKELVSYCM